MATKKKVVSHEIYNLTQQMYKAAIARERQVAHALYTYLRQRGRGQLPKHQSLRRLLEEEVFNHYTPLGRATKGSTFHTYNSQKLTAKLTYEMPIGSGQWHDAIFVLTPKQWKELDSLEKTGADDVGLLGIYYESRAIKRIFNQVIPHIANLQDLNHFDIIAGSNIGKMDAYLTFPSVTEKKDSNNKPVFSQSLWATYKMGVDIKSNSYRFAVGSVGQAGTKFLNNLMHQLGQKSITKSGLIQTRLFSTVSFESILAYNILRWKLQDQNYPIFFGATDGDFVLSSEMLRDGNGVFDVEYVPQIQGQVTQQAINAAKQTIRLDSSAVWQIATQAIIDNVIHTSLWYNRGVSGSGSKSSD